MERKGGKNKGLVTDVLSAPSVEISLAPLSIINLIAYAHRTFLGLSRQASMAFYGVIVLFRILSSPFSVLRT